MAITLTHTERQPGQTQYGLDTFTEIFKANDAADVVLLDPGVPQRGDAHPDYALMFVTDRHCTETGESASALDVVYMGTLVALPPQKATTNGQVATATTNTDSIIFPLTTTNPISVQFYAVTNSLDFYSDDPDDASEPDDPPEVSALISYDLGFGVQPGDCTGGVQDYLLTGAFIQNIIEAPPDIEPIIDGQFYHIVKRKTRSLLPYSPAC